MHLQEEIGELRQKGIYKAPQDFLSCKGGVAGSRPFHNRHAITGKGRDMIEPRKIVCIDDFEPHIGAEAMWKGISTCSTRLKRVITSRGRNDYRTNELFHPFPFEPFTDVPGDVLLGAVDDVDSPVREFPDRFVVFAYLRSFSARDILDVAGDSPCGCDGFPGGCW
jgi:hypothetical protein